MKGFDTRGAQRFAHGSSRPGRVNRLAVAACLFAAAAAHANPVVERDVQAMNERPARWLAHRDSLDERGLVFQFSQYGVSRHLLSPETVALLEREFDQFAPLCVRAQAPPLAVNASLQRWFREHADTAQAHAMMRGLREWLTAPLARAPIVGGMSTDGPSEAVASSTLEARRLAAEALGDWRDAGALPGLRALLATIPGGDPVIASAIRRISHPSLPEIIGFDREHRAQLGRRARDLDSVVVTWRAPETGVEGITRLDRAGSRRAWTALGRSLEFDWSRAPAPSKSPERPFRPIELAFHFRDGDRAWVALDTGPGYDYRESGRPAFRPRLIAPELLPALDAERARLGIEPVPPRFVEESVLLTIEPGELAVQGRYIFMGVPPEGTLSLRYPMADGPGLGIPVVTSMKLSHGGRLTPATIAFEQSGHEARTTLAPGRSHRYELIVEYRQPLTARAARYLVTTARAWGHPLERGRFVIQFSRALGEPRFSLPFREDPEDWDGHRKFVLDASPFDPATDIDVTW